MLQSRIQKIVTAALALTLFASLIGCISNNDNSNDLNSGSNGGNTGSNGVPVTIPKSAGLFPADQATNVPTDTLIYLTFNFTPGNSPTVKMLSSTPQLPSLGTPTIYGSDKHTVAFTLNSNLAPNTEYKLTYTDLNAPDNFTTTWSFKTGSGPGSPITQLAGDGQGGMWATDGNLLYYNLNNISTTNFASANMQNLSGGAAPISLLAGDGQGGMWAASGTGLFYSKMNASNNSGGAPITPQASSGNCTPTSSSVGAACSGGTTNSNVVLFPFGITPQNVITQLAGDGQGGMWVTDGTTLFYNKYPSRSMRPIIAVGVNIGAISQMAGDGKGGMWVTDGINLFYASVPVLSTNPQPVSTGVQNDPPYSTGVVVDPIPSPPNQIIPTLHVVGPMPSSSCKLAGDGQGGMWVSSGTQLFYNANGSTPPMALVGTAPNVITQISGDGYGGMWVTDSVNLYYFIVGSNQPILSNGPAKDGSSLDLLAGDGLGGMYAASQTNNLFYNYDGSNVGAPPSCGDCSSGAGSTGAVSTGSSPANIAMMPQGSTPNSSAITQIAGDGQGGVWVSSGSKLFNNQSSLVEMQYVGETQPSP